MAINFERCVLSTVTRMSAGHMAVNLNRMVWYGNSLFDITEKYIVIAKYLIKYMSICLETTQRIHGVLAAMQPPRKMLKYTA